VKNAVTPRALLLIFGLAAASCVVLSQNEDRPAFRPSSFAPPANFAPSETPVGFNAPAVEQYISSLAQAENVKRQLMQQGMETARELSYQSVSLRSNPDEEARDRTWTQITSRLNEQMADWNAFVANVEGLRPTSHTASLHRLYLAHVSFVRGAVQQSHTAFSLGQSHPTESLSQLKEQHESSGETARTANETALQADTELAALCNRYGLPKPVSIGGDF
jgi:hypothetical protein